MLVLDSGAVTRLARRDRETAALIGVLRREGLWPPLVPSVVVVESLPVGGTGKVQKADLRKQYGGVFS